MQYSHYICCLEIAKKVNVYLYKLFFDDLSKIYMQLQVQDLYSL
jgi:hypothetical protein